MKPKTYGLNHRKTWVSRILISKYPFRLNHALLSSIIRIGLIPGILFALFVYYRHAYISNSWLISYFFAMVFLNIGAYLIYHYNCVLLPNFSFKVANLLEDKNKLESLAEKYNDLYCKKYWISGGLFIAAISFVVFKSIPNLEMAGLFGINDPFFWLFYFDAVVLGIIGGYGFLGVILTILFIRDVSKEKIVIYPLNPDQLGGLSCVGYYAIGTTLLFSSGSLFLPMTFNLSPYAFFVVAIFISFTLFSFFYPTFIINREAQDVRDGILEEMRKRYNKLNQRISKYNKVSKINKIEIYSELDLMRNRYLDYRQLKLYPFKIEILVKLVGSVLLPIVFLIIERYDLIDRLFTAFE